MNSVLAIPGVLFQSYKPKIRIVIGTAWKKTAKNGDPYLKVRLDAFSTASGHDLYGKLWPMKDK